MEQKNTKIVDAARELLKAYGYFVDNLWHVDDVHFICEQNNLAQLTNQEAMEVFEIAKDQFEGETGLSWPKLEKALHTYLHRQSVLRIVCQKDAAV